MGKLSTLVTGVVTVAAMASAAVMAVAPTRQPAVGSAAAAPAALRVDGGGRSDPPIGFGEPGPVALAPDEPVVSGTAAPAGTSQVTPPPAAVANPTRVQTNRIASPRAPVALAPAGSSKPLAPATTAATTATTATTAPAVRRASEAAKPAEPEPERSGDEGSGDEPPGD